MTLKFTIEYPPSINHYYKHTRRAFYLSKRAWDFRQSVCLVARELQGVPTESPVCMECYVYPPDRRKRDLDNVIKAIQDAIQYAKIIMDDNQICKIYMERMPTFKGGKVDIALSEIDRV